MIYEFKAEDAERFGIEQGAKTRHRGNQLEFEKCPYCHSSHDKWTFGINTKTGQFECKRSSCGMKGNMITLSRDFDFSLGRDADAYYRTVDYSQKSYRKFINAHKQIEVRSGAIEYLKSRGISEDVIRKFEITTQPENDAVVVFPFKDAAGELTFIKYRNTQFKKGETKGSKEWCESNCKPILFGMNHCDPRISRLIITEGQIDSLSLATANLDNVVSVPTGCNGFTWIPYCYDFVNQFKQIVVMGDCEGGKITLVDELAKRWPTKVRVVKIEDYKSCKDANEILQKHGVLALKEAVENAEAPYNASIKPLAKVKQVDIMSIEKISTGMSELDEVLDGGFRMGQLAVLTGRRGEGKSTIASMWGVRALDQGYNSYFYSGELPDFYFKNWMDCQVTGKATHTASEDDALSKWYGDHAYIYDDTMSNKDELTDIIDAITIAIEQHNCRFILLDNLMTALSDDLSNDLYRHQSKFVGDLSAIAKKYNVFILLIAHPKKINGELDNDSISGSSNITDKADITLMYGRLQKTEDLTDTLREISVQKNRLTGKITRKPIQLTYDRGSRRVADSTVAMMDIRFNWNDEFMYADDSEIPF